jgi:hypothetical protein
VERFAWQSLVFKVTWLVTLGFLPQLIVDLYRLALPPD